MDFSVDCMYELCYRMQSEYRENPIKIVTATFMKIIILATQFLKGVLIFPEINNTDKKKQILLQELIN